MDTRIEELASIICERCNANSGMKGEDRAETYKEIKNHTMAIYRLLQGYRQRHPEEYGN